MPALNEIFPHILCINLDRRPERWSATQEEFDRLQITGVTRIAAVDARQLQIPDRWSDPPGAYGCLQSHLKAVRHARDQGWPHVLILEDDVVFANDLHERLAEIAGELPEKWAMLSLGGIHREAPGEYSTGLCRMRQTLSTHAYALSAWFYDAFIQAHQEENDPVDVTNTCLQRDHPCFCAMPHLAWQRDGWSDVQLERESHWSIRESLVLVGDSMDLLLRHTTVVIAYNGSGGPANLSHVMRFYGENYPDMEILVIGNRPAPWTKEPPVPSRYFQVAEDAERDEMLRFGYSFARKPNQIFIFTDADVVPTRERYIRAAVRMCEKVDGASGFAQLITLNKDDSMRVRRGQQKAVDLESYEPMSDLPADRALCIVTRDGLDRLGGWFPEDLGELDLYPSPNRALRLS
ncbi:MAG: glycosyltransferase family 25 protein [Acidobacteriota bacterium]|nr:glycosyltransferase family 25 protein [Acidobacteriota bacterium]